MVTKLPRNKGVRPLRLDGECLFHCEYVDLKNKIQEIKKAFRADNILSKKEGRTEKKLNCSSLKIIKQFIKTLIFFEKRHTVLNLKEQARPTGFWRMNS